MADAKVLVLIVVGLMAGVFFTLCAHAGLQKFKITTCAGNRDDSENRFVFNFNLDESWPKLFLQKLFFRLMFSDFGLGWLKEGDYAGPAIKVRLALIPDLFPN